MSAQKLRRVIEKISFNDISIRYSFIIMLALVVTPLFIIVSGFYYNQIKDGIIKNSEIAVSQSRDSILNTIQITEKSYEFISANYEEMMRSCLIEFRNEYEIQAQNVNEIDIEKLKKKYNSKMDLYIINSEGVIVRSTFPEALGLDFSTMPKFYSTLENIRRGDLIEISKVTTDLITNELRKWGYISTKDHNWLLEVGINSEELAKYVEPIDYVSMENKITESNPYIKSVRVYDMHGTDLGYDVPARADKKTIVMSVMDSGKTKYNYLRNGLVDSEYVFLNTFTDALDDSKKVLEIQYNNSVILEQIHSLRISIALLFFVYTLSSLIVIRLITNKYIIKPLVKLTFEIAEVDEFNNRIKATVIGNNEVGKLAQTFNHVKARLNDSMVSKKYMVNVINSVGDIVILTDKNLDIIQINRFGKETLCLDIGNNINKVIFETEMFDEIKERLMTQNTLTDVEIVMRDRNLNKIVLLSTWSMLVSDAGEVEGYICNAKNYTKTKAFIQNLSDKNTELFTKEQQLIEKASKDYLTQLYSRSFVLDNLNKLLENWTADSKLCILMMDIDYFKQINDNYGHPVGDEVLISISKIIVNNLREADFAGRYGGEEFLIVLPKAGLEMGLSIAENIRSDIESTSYTRNQLRVTISGGLAFWKGETSSELIAEVDRQLYLSKNKGRNRISYRG